MTKKKTHFTNGLDDLIVTSELKQVNVGWVNVSWVNVSWVNIDLVNINWVNVKSAKFSLTRLIHHVLLSSLTNYHCN